MKISLRALAAGSFLTALAAAGLTAHPALAEAAGVDFWQLPDLRFGADRSAAEGRELDRQGEVIYHRTTVRYETVRDVAEGRLSFEEGVARFVQLNRSNPTALARDPFRAPRREGRCGAIRPRPTPKRRGGTKRTARSFSQEPWLAV